MVFSQYYLSRVSISEIFSIQREWVNQLKEIKIEEVKTNQPSEIGRKVFQPKFIKRS
jgi:hypothetical protein